MTEESDTLAACLRLKALELRSVTHMDALTQQEAIDLAIEAAELQLKFLKSAKTKSEKASFTSKFNSLVETAERIKQLTDWPPSQDEEKLLDLDPPTSILALELPAPISDREMTRHEKILILQGSKLHGFKFPPWDRNPGMAEFSSERELDDQDKIELPMSKEQKDLLDSWKRPSEALPPLAWAVQASKSAGNQEDIPHMTKKKPIDLAQDAATDCSFVASLCTTIARAAQGHNKILRNIMFPYDESAGNPRLSPNGRYIFKLNFNGTFRKVVIDDKLPVSKTFQSLHVVDRNDPCLLWPALLEKAYLKVRGGYDFPGSNSATDLWLLTGWIPEQFAFRSPDLDRDNLWQKLKHHLQLGNVLVTVGTGNISETVEATIGLIGQHDYALLEMIEDGGQRRILIKNPWSTGTEWISQTESLGKQSDEEALPTMEPPTEEDLEKRFAVLDASSEHTIVDDSGRSDPTRSDGQRSPGTFWIGYADMLHNFDYLYLNWNPGLFKYRQDIHFEWDLLYGRSPPGSFATNPQHVVSLARSGKLWLLLSRHFANDAPTFERTPRYISIFAFNSGGMRVSTSKGALEQGAYVDSPQTLLRLDEASAQTRYVIVTSEEDLVASKHVFTLSAFSTVPVSLDLAPSRFSDRQIVHGSWTAENAGGNVSSPKYSENPQFSLFLSRATPLSLIIQTSNENLRIHVKLVHGNGNRVYDLRKRDILTDSGDYRAGYALAERLDRLAAGKYTIICSTFESGQVGDFTLILESDCSAKLTPIHTERAGRMTTVLADASFGSGVKILAAPIRPSRLTTARLVARYANTDDASGGALEPQRRISSPSPIRMTIELGRGPDRRIIIASAAGEFSDSPSGVRTEDVVLDPSMVTNVDMWLVLERLGGGYSSLRRIEERIQVEAYWEAAESPAFGVWREFVR